MYKRQTQRDALAVRVGYRFCRRLTLVQREIVLADAADGAYPVVGDVRKGGARRDAAVRVAHFRVLDVAAYVANVLVHGNLPVVEWLQHAYPPTGSVSAQAGIRSETIR